MGLLPGGNHSWSFLHLTAHPQSFHPSLLELSVAGFEFKATKGARGEEQKCFAVAVTLLGKSDPTLSKQPQSSVVLERLIGDKLPPKMVVRKLSDFPRLNLFSLGCSETFWSPLSGDHIASI